MTAGALSRIVPAPLPSNEAERLAALHRYQILDTGAEAAFDRLTRLAADLFDTPIALISLIDAKRQWFKSRLGIDRNETDRDLAFCAHAILKDEVMVVPDATVDQRFANNPLVTAYPDIRFYAGAPLMTHDGLALGTLCVIDRAPHRSFDARAQHRLADLAALVVDELELRLALMETEEAKASAEKANRDKGRFVATMSHEIRTPLNGIIGTAKLLSGSTLEPYQRTYVDTLVRSAEGLQFLVNDILDFSKIEAGALDLSPETFELGALIDDIVALFGPRAEEKGIALNVKSATMKPLWLEADGRRLRQVLLNLVGNAVKFTEVGSVTIEISQTAPITDIAPLRFAILDTGIGIDSAAKRRLFKDFEQADPGISRKFGGTGLGLAISQGILERMGGRIEVDSVPGRGSSFWCELELPLGQTPVSKAPPVETRQVALKVLMAEDNPVNQMVALEMLKRAGHTVTVVETGKAAIEACLRNRYDIVLMDVQMPEMNGIDATRAIRALPSPNGVMPIVALTANAFETDREECLAAGMDAHVGKPINFQSLFALMAELVQEATARNGAGGGEPEASPPSTGSTAMTNGSTTPILNLEPLTSLRQHVDDATFGAIGESFRTSAVRLIGELNAAAHKRDMTALEYASHTIQGMAGALGLERLALESRSVVAALRQQKEEQAITLARSIPQTVDESLAALSRALAEVMAR